MSSRTGLVIRIDAKRCHVDVDGEVYLLSPRGKLFENRGQVKNPIAVGDRVRVVLTGDGGGSIEEVLPRRSKLARASAGEGTREQVMVANVDQVLVVSAIQEPAFRPDLVDRILAGAERAAIEARVVINKVDRASAGAWIAFYSGLGYDCHATSAVTGAGIDALAACLEDHITVFCGMSGTGKSSLLNAVQPGLALRVGVVSKRGRREGRHTTTHSSLLRLSGGGWVVDTPGIRNFGLFGAAPSEIAGLFREFRAQLGHCTFQDCTHEHEPDCAVKRALAAGLIPESRYASYIGLLEDARDGSL